MLCTKFKWTVQGLLHFQGNITHHSSTVVLRVCVVVDIALEPVTRFGNQGSLAARANEDHTLEIKLTLQEIKGSFNLVQLSDLKGNISVGGKRPGRLMYKLNDHNRLGIHENTVYMGKNDQQKVCPI